MATAFVFPGQGSQAVGMLGEIAEHEPEIINTFTEASDALGLDLWDIVTNGPEAELNRTDITQPALLASGVAIWRLWTKYRGDMPAYMAGHSLGEYTALVCAEALDFSETVSLVRDRGLYMQQAVPEGKGGMAAILGLDSQIVTGLCEKARAEGIVSAANFNSTEQIVVGGEIKAVNHVMDQARQAGAKRVILLSVSVPSHCELMMSAAEKLEDRLISINLRNATVPVVQNVDARPHSQAQEIKSLLIKQLHQPVYWVDCVNRLYELGCTRIVECGPGKVLTGLAKRINRNIEAVSIHTYTALQSELEHK